MSAILKSPDFDELDESRSTIYVRTRAMHLILHCVTFESTIKQVKTTFFQTFRWSELARVLPAGLLYYNYRSTFIIIHRAKIEEKPSLSESS